MVGLFFSEADRTSEVEIFLFLVSIILFSSGLGMVEGILVISSQDYTKQQIIKYPGKLLIPYQSFQAVAIFILTH